MTFGEIEKIFNRSLRLSFSKRKWLLVFPILCLCGLITVICRIISFHAGQWVQMSVTFLPVFLCSGLLLGAGIILIRIYHHQVKGLKINYFETIKKSKALFLGVSYLAIPLIFSYLILWMALGFFYLLRAIPSIGDILSSVLAFGPFLLVLGSIVLSLINLLILFFVTPAAALKSNIGLELAKKIVRDLKNSPFQTFLLSLVGLVPLFLVAAMLCLAAIVTQLMYIETQHGFSIALKWLFMMVPFCALLSPSVVFFFNFSAECYAHMHKKQQITR